MIKYIHPENIKSSQGLVAEIYAQIKRDFGKVVEPFVLHSPVPRLLAGVWTACRETELTGIVPRNTKEAVAAAVSAANHCPYCVDAHTIMLDAAGEHNVANSIHRARYSQIRNAKLSSIVQWAMVTGKSQKALPSLIPFSEAEAPEIIGTAVFYHYINRMTTILLSETPLPTSKLWLKSSLRRIAGRLFAPAVRRSKTAGESLKFLPPAELPADLGWAAANPTVAQAFARFSAVIEDVGQQVIPFQARKRIADFILRWQGEVVEPSKLWNAFETHDLDEGTKSTAQLALMAAIAPWQMDENAILRFRQHFPEEHRLLGTLAWGSFSASRRIGTWIKTPNF